MYISVCQAENREWDYPIKFLSKRILGDARAERAWHLRLKRTTGTGKGGDASGKEWPICGDGGDVVKLIKKLPKVTPHLMQRHTGRDRAEVWWD